MIFDLIGVICMVLVVGFIANTIMDSRKKDKQDRMSFKESMDLVDLPVITFYNEGKKFNFLLDTGATKSVIDSNVLSDFHHEKIDSTGVLWGMEGNTINVSYIKASLSYKDKFYEEDFQVVDMSDSFGKVKAESGVTLSGILGNSFFVKYQYVLDFNSLIAYSKK